MFSLFSRQPNCYDMRFYMLGLVQNTLLYCPSSKILQLFSKPEETEEQIEQLAESLRNYKKWRKQQMTLFGAEQLLAREQSKRELKQKFSAAAAKYVPSSLQEIQAGTTLEAAKYSRVSFDPDVKYDDDPKPETEPEAIEAPEAELPLEAVVEDNEVGKLVGVADVTLALVVCPLSLSFSDKKSDII